MEIGSYEPCDTMRKCQRLLFLEIQVFVQDEKVKKKPLSSLQTHIYIYIKKTTRHCPDSVTCSRLAIPNTKT